MTTNLLKSYFPMIQSREEILARIYSNPKLQQLFERTRSVANVSRARRRTRMGFLGLGDEAVLRLVDSRRCRPRRVERECEIVRQARYCCKHRV